MVLRPGDAREVAGACLTAGAALWRSWRSSIYRRALKVDGTLAAAWGVSGNFLSSEGYTWLLTSAAFERAPVAICKIARREVALMLETYQRLSGMVDANYTQAIRFLGFLGFTIEPNEIKIPKTGAVFRYYWMER